MGIKTTVINNKTAQLLKGSKIMAPQSVLVNPETRDVYGDITTPFPGDYTKNAVRDASGNRIDGFTNRRAIINNIMAQINSIISNPQFTLFHANINLPSGDPNLIDGGNMRDHLWNEIVFRENNGEIVGINRTNITLPTAFFGDNETNNMFNDIFKNRGRQAGWMITGYFGKLMNNKNIKKENGTGPLGSYPKGKLKYETFDNRGFSTGFTSVKLHNKTNATPTWLYVITEPQIPKETRDDLSTSQLNSWNIDRIFNQPYPNFTGTVGRNNYVRRGSARSLNLNPQFTNMTNGGSKVLNNPWGNYESSNVNATKYYFRRFSNNLIMQILIGEKEGFYTTTSSINAKYKKEKDTGYQNFKTVLKANKLYEKKLQRNMYFDESFVSSRPFKFNWSWYDSRSYELYQNVWNDINAGRHKSTKINELYERFGTPKLIEKTTNRTKVPKSTITTTAWYLKIWIKMDKFLVQSLQSHIKNMGSTPLSKDLRYRSGALQFGYFDITNGGPNYKLPGTPFLMNQQSLRITCDNTVNNLRKVKDSDAWIFGTNVHANEEPIITSTNYIKKGFRTFAPKNMEIPYLSTMYNIQNSKEEYRAALRGYIFSCFLKYFGNAAYQLEACGDPFYPTRDPNNNWFNPAHRFNGDFTGNPPYLISQLAHAITEGTWWFDDNANGFIPSNDELVGPDAVQWRNLGFRNNSLQPFDPAI
tara:strand:+ start:3288 stop:5390 length:2103 start_codon:yes stop_codon:yes gene_type:complete